MFNEDYDLISRCIHDIIAEPHRSELIPEFRNLKEIAISNGSIGFGISGSGPSMFSLARGPEKAYFIKKELEKHLQIKKINFKSYVSSVNDEGVKII